RHPHLPRTRRRPRAPLGLRRPRPRGHRRPRRGHRPDPARQVPAHRRRRLAHRDLRRGPRPPHRAGPRSPALRRGRLVRRRAAVARRPVRVRDRPVARRVPDPHDRRGAPRTRPRRVPRPPRVRRPPRRGGPRRRGRRRLHRLAGPRVAAHGARHGRPRRLARRPRRRARDRPRDGPAPLRRRLPPHRLRLARRRRDDLARRRAPRLRRAQRRRPARGVPRVRDVDGLRARPGDPARGPAGPAAVPPRPVRAARPPARLPPRPRRRGPRRVRRRADDRRRPGRGVAAALRRLRGGRVAPAAKGVLMTSIGIRPKAAGAGPPAPRRPRSTWHVIASGVVLGWLALTAAAALAHPGLPVPRWLLVHLFLLGAVTNAIVTWTEHFATALLRLPPPGRWPMARLAILNAGIAAVLGGVAGGFPLIAAGGAGAVVAVVAAHVAVLAVRGRGALGGRFAHVVGWYVWAGTALVAGGSLGGLLASGRAPASWHAPMQAAHAHVNLLGWVGLTVLGTLFTLWPTVLRTRMDDGVGPIARWSLRAAVPGLAVATGGLLAGQRWVAAAGLLLYAGAAALALVPFVRTLLRRRPHTPASWMLAAGTAWSAGTLAADAARQSLDGLLPLVFVGQTLLGALTFLLPVVLGGGPAALKANAAVLERLWAPRVAAVNAAVPLLVLPVPGWASRAGWIVAVAALGSFVVLAAATVLRTHRPSPVVAGITAGVLLTALAAGVAAGGGAE